MAAIETGLFSYLGGLAYVTAPIYFQKAPDNASGVFIVYHKVSGVREVSHSGHSNLTLSRFRFTAYSGDPEAAKTAALTIVRAFSGYKGAAGAETIYGSSVDAERDAYNEDANLFETEIDVLMWHREAFP